MVGIDAAEKRKKAISNPKLIIGDNVEVRRLDDGFMGSWHSGVVIHYERGFRKVQYKNILRDDESQISNDLINVHPAVDGLTSLGRTRHFYRSLIRPIPPHLSFNKLSLHYGQCVDAYYREAWWEGVIFDNENASDVRSIFFPDIGDLMRIRVDNLRITQDWDEYTQEWKRRGTWYLLELIQQFEKENLLHVSVRQIWYEMRGKKDFQLIKEWSNSVSKRYVWASLLWGIIEYHSKVAAENYYGEVAESMLSVNYENRPKRLDAVNIDDLNAVCNQNKIHGDDLKVVCEEEEIQGDSLSLACDQFPSDRKRKRKWEIAGTEVNTVKEIHGDDLNSVCDQLRTNRGKKQKLKWEIAGRNLLPEAEFCPSSVLEYLNCSSANRNMPTSSLALKVRKHLAYLGWKVETCTRRGKLMMRYTSPDRKTYTSLVTVCKNWDTITIEGGEKYVFAPPLPSPHHIETFSSSISIEPMQHIKVGDEVSGKLISSERFSSSIPNDFSEFNIAKLVLVEEHHGEGTCGDNDSGAEVNAAPLITEEEQIHEDHFVSKSNAKEEGEKLDFSFSSSSSTGIHVEVLPSSQSTNHNNPFMLQDSNTSNNFVPLLFERPFEKKNYVECQIAEHEIVPEAGICPNSVVKSKMEGLRKCNLATLSNIEATREEIPCSPPSIVPCNEAISVNEIFRQEELNIVEKELPNCNNFEIASTDVVPEAKSMNHCVFLGSEEKYENTTCSKHANNDELPEKGNKILMYCNLIACKAYAEGEVNNGVEKGLVSEPKQNINVADEVFDKLIDVQEFDSSLHLELGEFENEKNLAIVEHQNVVSRDTLPSGMTSSSVTTACETFNLAGKSLVSEPKQNTNVADEALGKLIATQRFSSNLVMEPGEFEKENSLAIEEHQNEVSQNTFASGMTNISISTAREACIFYGKPLVLESKQHIKIADEAFVKLVDIERLPTNLHMEFGEIEMEKFSANGGADGVPPCSSNCLDQITGQKTCSSEDNEKEEFALVPLPDSRSYFSRLIDSGVVSTGEKVYYYVRKKSGASFKEGQITREGIMCNCCQNIFGLSKFEAHAGSTYHRPAANIFLEDGTSLFQCQLKLKCRDNLNKTFASPPQQKSNHGNLRNIGTLPRQPKSSNKIKKIAIPSPLPKRGWGLSTNDSICSVCLLGGQLILCHECPSSFHQECLSLKDIPHGEWFCLSCCCEICGRNKFITGSEQNMEGSVLNCHQCSRIYHVGCLFKQGDTNIHRRHKEKWFCNKKCEQIFLGLRKLLGRPVVVGDDNLTWTLFKYTTHNDLDDDGMDSVEILSNLNLATSLINECFGPLKEPRTKTDIAKDIIFSRGSKMKRLNFQGFYTVLLSRDDEPISVAAVRVHGEKVAEVPLIGTRFQYRRKEMCRLLMNVLEKKLMELGVERLVVQVTPKVLSTWTASFGLLETTQSERLNFLSYTFLDFLGTAMCHKILSQSAPSINNCAGTQQNIHDSVNGSDNADVNKKIESLEICQAEQTGGEIMYQETKTSAITSGVNGGNGTPPLILRR